MIEIKSQGAVDAQVRVPGSKSYTHRLLIASALSDGRCRVKNALKSEDTRFTLTALRQLGADIQEAEDGSLWVRGCSGALQAPNAPIYLGNSGTSMRLLTGVAALAKGKTVLTGTERMGQRPIRDLLDALKQLGVLARSLNANGCPPVEIHGGAIPGTQADIDCGVSSQYLSALLLIAPCTQNGLSVTVSRGPVSKPYIDLTVEVMARLGINVAREGYTAFHVPGKQRYQPGEYEVEPDVSNASYFWAAAAVTGGRVTVKGINQNSGQGDLRITALLERMGCQCQAEADGISVIGGELSAIETDMGDLPDMVPTLAVVAAFAKGTTVIQNVAHLKAKESNRLLAVATELGKMGISAEVLDDGLKITGGSPQGATIETYDDHRIAMSFAVAGLRAPGTRIADPGCVEKSFPDFWTVFSEMYRP